MTYILFGLLCAGVVFLITKSKMGAAVAGVAAVVFSFLTMPVLSLDFMWTYVMPMFAIGLGLAIPPSDLPEESINKYLKVGGAAVGLLIAVFFVTSSEMLNANKYYQLIGEVQERTNSFNEDVQAVDNSEIRIIDEDTARVLASKKLDDPKYGKKYRLGKLSIQDFRGKLYWVAPLEYATFFRWLNADTGAPAYVMVSSTNSSDVKLIKNYTYIDQKTNKKQEIAVDIKWQESGAFFDYNINRHLYTNGYGGYGITDVTFEIDNNMKPWYVASLYKNKIGFSGADVAKIALIDPKTGKITDYNVEDAPDWVDRIYPEWIVAEQLYGWGEYKNGWLNASLFGGGDEVLRGTRGISIVHSLGKSYFYTGIKLSGQDSSLGFTLIDTKTKEAFWYALNGATEANAAKNAEGEVQEKGYNATNPILYNVNGVPTLIMALKNKEGIVSMIAMVNYANYSLVAAAKNFKGAYRKYQSILAKGQTSDIGIGDISRLAKVKGTIVRIVSFSDFSKMVISENLGKMFIVSTNIAPQVSIAAVGDKVTIRYNDVDQVTVDAVMFTNNTMPMTKSKKEAVVDKKESKHVDELIKIKALKDKVSEMENNMK